VWPSLQQKRGAERVKEIDGQASQMNQKIILALIASAVVINLVIAIADVHGQGPGKSQNKIKINLTGTATIEKEIQKQKPSEQYADPCLLYYSAHLVIIELTCPTHADSIQSYLGQGYQITVVWNNAMYLTK
jgi:hypothetical protein